MRELRCFLYQIQLLVQNRPTNLQKTYQSNTTLHWELVRQFGPSVESNLILVESRVGVQEDHGVAGRMVKACDCFRAPRVASQPS